MGNSFNHFQRDFNPTAPFTGKYTNTKTSRAQTDTEMCHHIAVI